MGKYDNLPAHLHRSAHNADPITVIVHNITAAAIKHDITLTEINIRSARQGSHLKLESIK
jgi:hypothetical protein